MPPPKITTRVPLPGAGFSAACAYASGAGNKPSDCIIMKVALYPPAWPTRIKKSRRVNPISFCSKFFVHKPARISVRAGEPRGRCMYYAPQCCALIKLEDDLQSEL